MRSLRPTVLVISESLEKTDIDALKGLGIETTDWPDVRNLRPSDYEILIIDTRMLRAQERRSYRNVFRNMRSETEALLRADVVFVLAGPRVSLQYETARHMELIESNHDFLPPAVLVATELNSAESRRGTRFIVTDKQWTDYFESVSAYFKVIGGIEKIERDWAFCYPVDPAEPRSLFSGPAHPLAVTTATSQVIGRLIPWQSGTIGLFPPPDK